jgi:uncharacterized protein (DUF983 family)
MDKIQNRRGNMSENKTGLVQSLWLGFTLRCPHCQQGGMMKNFFEPHELCPHCGVRFERATGEGTGAMVILISGLPIMAILLFFIVRLLNPEFPLIPLAFGLCVFLAVLMLVMYRHARGLWIGVIYHTGGLFTDEEFKMKK